MLSVYLFYLYICFICISVLKCNVVFIYIFIFLGQPIKEFIGLRSKMYSYTCGYNEVKRANGIGKVTIAKDLKHEQYRQCLFKQTQVMCSVNTIQSKNHQLYVINVQKCGLNAFDDKRYILDDGISTWAHGHKDIINNN